MMIDHLTASITLAALTALAGCARAGSAADPPPAGRPDPKRIDALFAPYDHSDTPGASVVVIHDGHVVFTRAYGMADLETHTPATIETDYRLASLTKEFTAMAVMLLARDGRLRYDEHVRDILPELPAYARDVTIRNLLNHTSGLWDYEDFVPDTASVQVKDRDVLALMTRADSTYFPPGTAFRYSNTGYALLSLVVQRVSGESFARFLYDRIFAPLGMRSTLAYEAGISTVPYRAYGYTIDSTGVRRTDQSPTSAVLGDGGVYSSVADLVAWDHALETGTLVPDSTLRRLAWAPPTLPTGTRTHYGFGWFVDQDRGTLRLTHYGETMGFRNAILRYPARRLTVIVLTNRNSGAPWDIAQAIADLWLPAEPVEPPWPFKLP